MNKMNSETQKVVERYEKRKSSDLVLKSSDNYFYNHFIQSERELKYAEILYKHFQSLDSVKFLEIGAGTGVNLFFLKKTGLKWENIYANELIPDRIKILRDTFPQVRIYEGDAMSLQFPGIDSFDVIFQSTVFTSLLDYNFKMGLAGKMWNLLKPGGMILWYDFAFDNPKNKDVKGIKKAEIRKLFPASKSIIFHKVTLAPPIGRRINKLYPLFNVFPFLRTHIIAEIEK